MGKYFKSVYLMIFALIFICNFVTIDASFSFSRSSSGYGGSGGYGGYSSGSGGKSRKHTDPILRDNDVEDIKRDSIHRHVMFAVNRFISWYIAPTIQFLWINLLSPVFDMMWKGYSYLNDFMWNVYDTGYWLYVNTLYPVLFSIWENIYSLTIFISDIFNHLYTNYIQPVITWCINGIYDYMYSPMASFIQIIWDNIVWILSSISDICSSFFWWIYDGIIYITTHVIECIVTAMNAFKDVLHDLYIKTVNGIKWTANCIYHYALKPLGRLCVKLWSDYIYPMINSMYEFFVKLIQMMYDGMIYITTHAIEYIDTAFNVLRDLLHDLYPKIVNGIKWTANYFYEYVLKPLGRLFVKLWPDYIYPMLDSIYQFLVQLTEIMYEPATAAYNFMYDNIASLLKYIVDGFKKTAVLIYDYVLEPLGRLFQSLFVKLKSYCLSLIEIIVKYMTSFMKYIVEEFPKIVTVIYDYVLEPLGNIVYHYVLEPLGRLFQNLFVKLKSYCLSLMEIIVNGLKSIGNALFAHILEPLGKFLNTVWNEYISAALTYLQKLFDNLYDILYFSLRKIFKLIWDILCYGGTSIIWIYDETHRYLLEMNVYKLKMPKQKGFLNNFEIGVYYATMEQKQNILYLTPYDDYVYLWLRNNNKLKRANAKIMIYDNTTKINEKMVRLNKKQSHAIPLKKNLFQNEQKKCRKIQIEFILEDISKTVKDQSNRRSIANQNNNRNSNGNTGNGGNNRDNGIGNVGLSGDGAAYIAVDNKTKCQHQFSLCYQ